MTAKLTPVLISFKVKFAGILMEVFSSKFLYHCTRPDTLRTVVRGNFNIHGTKNFQDAVFHQKSKIYDFSSILNLQLRFLSPFLMKKKILKKKKKIAGKILILIFFNFSLLQWVQGFQALILVIIKGFQAFRVQRLEFRGYLERRFYVIFQS